MNILKLQKPIWNKRHTLKQALGFCIVGFFGVLINGIVYSCLSQFEIFNGVPWTQFFSNTPFYHIFSFLNSITWAWGIGILVATLSNFILNKWLVFKS